MIFSKKYSYSLVSIASVYGCNIKLLVPTVYAVYLAVILIWLFSNFCPSVKFK